MWRSKPGSPARTCGAASTTNDPSSKPRAADWHFSTTTTTAGSTSISPTETGWIPSGLHGKAPTSHLYKNNRDGTFTDVTEKSGLGRTGWQTGVCVGDYDNDGWDDLFCCFWGHNILFHNNGDGTFTDVTQKAGLRPGEGSLGRRLHISRLRPRRPPRSFRLQLHQARSGKRSLRRTTPAICQWKGVPIMCGPRGLPGDTNILYHNNGDGTFTDVSEKAGILKPGPRYSITAVSYDFDNDGWPDIYVAVDSEAQHPVQEQP